MNLQEALTKGVFVLEQKGIESPQLSCELILAHAMEMSRSALLGAADRVLKGAEEAQFKSLLARCAGHEPLEYLIEKVEFYSLEFRVTKGVFIPRPESETLVEKSLELLKDNDAPKVLDLCTGCGSLIIALILNLDDGEFWGTDISKNAIQVAEFNGRKHDVHRIVEFREGNLFQPLREELANNFDLIVCNPPYIRTAEIQKLPVNIREHEPHVALDGGRDGLNFFRSIIDNATQFLSPQGSVLVELDPTLVKPVEQLVARKGNMFETPQFFNDLSGKERVLLLRPKSRGGFGR